MFPAIVFPDFVIELETSVPMWAGRPETGGGLFPGPVFQLPPHTGGVRVIVPAKPLKDESTGPPVRLVRLDPLDDTQVTVGDGVAFATVRLPSTKAPREGKAKMKPDAVPDEGL